MWTILAAVAAWFALAAPITSAVNTGINIVNEHQTWIKAGCPVRYLSDRMVHYECKAAVMVTKR